MISTRWWWIRHAPSAGLPGIIHGQDNVDADLRNEKALEELSRLQRRLVSKDATKVYGKEHPDATKMNEL